MSNNRIIVRGNFSIPSLLAILLITLAITGCYLFSTPSKTAYFAHPAIEDQFGVIAPWYQELNGQFDLRVRISAETMKRFPWSGPWVGPRLPNYLIGGNWKIADDGTISIPATARDADYGYRIYYVLYGLVDYYRYTGDPAAIAHITMQANHLLDYTLTGPDHPWPGFPISVPWDYSADGHARPNWIQLDVAAHEGLVLLKAYQLVGEPRWLEAAKHWGDLFAQNLKRDPSSAPWDRFAGTLPQTNSLAQIAGGPQGNRLTGGVAMILEFLDELVRMGYKGPQGSIVDARDKAQVYLRDKLLPAWTEVDTWGRFFWDWEAAVQTVGPTDAAARYMMTHPEYFPNWRTDVRNIMGLYLHHTGVHPGSAGDVYSGAWAYPESSGCCGLSLDYSPMEMAAAYAQYGVTAGSEWAREMARRQMIISTYHFTENGVVKDGIDGSQIVAGTWFKIVHPWPLKYVLETMGWLPEILGPNRENHIMRTSSVVRSVIYGKGKIEYSTFSAPAESIDVLRLAFAPTLVSGDGTPLRLREDLKGSGFTSNRMENGDCIIAIRHDGLTSIVVEGEDPQQVMDDAEFKYTGQWKTGQDSKYLNGTVHSTPVFSSSLTCEFTGNQVRLIGSVGPTGGLADVYIDNVKQLAGIDEWNPRSLDRQVLYYRNGLSQARHQLKVVVRNERNPRAEGTFFSVDALQFSAATGSAGFGAGGGPKEVQRMIFGYPDREYVDSSGNRWLPATEFIVRSGPLTDPVKLAWWRQPAEGNIAGTPQPELYRYGVHAAAFWTHVTVGPGSYYVRLKFAERRKELGEASKRATSIFINGKKVVSDMDLAATAGGFQKAADLVFNNIQPRNGAIEIRFTNEHGGEAAVQALEIGPGTGGQGAKPVSVDSVSKPGGN
jgi:hypothetical protein